MILQMLVTGKTGGVSLLLTKAGKFGALSLRQISMLYSPKIGVCSFVKLYLYDNGNVTALRIIRFDWRMGPVSAGGNMAVFPMNYSGLPSAEARDTRSSRHAAGWKA